MRVMVVSGGRTVSLGRYGNRERAGVALIIAFSMLAVLAVLATSFGRLMVLERDSAGNYHVSTQARLAAEAGVEHAIAGLLTDLRKGRLEDRDAAWRYFGEDADRDDVNDDDEDADLDGIVERSECPLLDAAAPSYRVAGTDHSGELTGARLPAGWTIRYKLKIADCNSMINLNGNHPHFPRLLDTFGVMLEKHLALDRNPIEEIQFGKNDKGEPIRGGQAIVLYRYTLPDKVFRSREDLLPILARGQADLALIEPYLTVHGWRDDNAFLDRKRQIDGYPGAHWTEYWWGPLFAVGVPRYPINVNVADKVVLDAVNGLGSAAYPAETPQRDFFWPKPQHVSGGARARAKESDFRIFVHGWWWGPGGGAKWWSQMLRNRRRGDEVDANGDDLMQANEDTIRNGWPDYGPFRMSQDYAHFPQRVDHAGYEFMVGAFTPHAPITRYNPDYMVTSFHHGGSNGRSFQWGSRFLSEKVTAGNIVPEWCFRPYGVFEITSLGIVRDAAGDVVATRTIRTSTRLFHPIEHQTQRDFLTKPKKDTSWRTGQVRPVEPWSAQDANKRLWRTTTFPENAWDARSGKGAFDAEKAEPWFGAVMPASMDWVRNSELFFASFKKDAKAERGLGGTVPTAGSNDGKVHNEGVSMGNATLATGSDLYTDGIYHHRWRRRSTTYPNVDFKNMRPDQGMHEFWWKSDSQQYPGEIFTAFFPADPSFAPKSTEGIQHRVFLAYVPLQTTAFKGLIQLPAFHTAGQTYYRWWNWGPLSGDGVLSVPVLVAERVFYTAMREIDTGVIRGRDSGYLDLQTSASYAGGQYAFRCANWIDYEYFPLLNWGRDQMWHHVRVTWKDGTDIELHVDGARAPYRRTWPESVWATGAVVTPYWGYEEMPPEIHIGGVDKPEARHGVAWKWDPGFKWGPAPGGRYWGFPGPMWFMWTHGGGVNYRHCGTIDDVRIFANPNQSWNGNRYVVTKLPDGTHHYGTYSNEIRMPDDATRLVRVAWDQWQPTYDPRVVRDRFLTGRHIQVQERPLVVLEVETKAGSLKMDEKTMTAAPYNEAPEDAAEIARGAGYSVALELEPGEVVTYKAHFLARSTKHHSVAPILESVTFFYTIAAPEFLSWEEF